MKSKKVLIPRFAVRSADSLLPFTRAGFRIAANEANMPTASRALNRVIMIDRVVFATELEALQLDL